MSESREMVIVHFLAMHFGALYENRKCLTEAVVVDVHVLMDVDVDGIFP